MWLSRSVLWLCAALLLGIAGYCIPAFFRSVDLSVLEVAASEEPDLTEIAESYIVGGNPSAAQFLLGEDPAGKATESEIHPLWNRLTEGNEEAAAATASLLSSLQRSRAVALLEESDLEGVRRLLPEILQEPALTTPPEARMAIIPLRIGSLLTAFLAAERHFQPSFLSELVAWSTSPDPFIQGKWGIFSSQVAIWGSVVPFGALGQYFESFESPSEALEFAKLATIPSSPSRSFLVRLGLAGADPESVISYLTSFPESSRTDLSIAFEQGPGSVDYLLSAAQPIYRDSLLPSLPGFSGFPAAIRFAYAQPQAALFTRVSLFIIAFLCLISALSLWLPNPGDRFLEKPRTFQTIFRRLILASILTATLFFIFEPSLLQQPDSVKTQSNALLSFSSLTNPPIQPNMLNSITIDSVTLLILAIFLVLQLGLYFFCLVKLSEIRRQHIPDETKIRLLENEENLFDSGLYLGLGGTVASLILLAVGVVEASLMAAYASTLFGILFVSFFKIFHLRPLKRRLILASNLNG